LLHKLIILLNKSHFSLLCAKLTCLKFYGHNNSALCNNLDHLHFTW